MNQQDLRDNRARSDPCAAPPVDVLRSGSLNSGKVAERRRIWLAGLRRKEKEKKKNNMAAAARRLEEEKLCMSAEKGGSGQRAAGLHA